jgi:hypothetical protein
MDEIERPAGIHLCFDQDWRSCSDRSSPSLALADCQTFLPIKPIDGKRRPQATSFNGWLTA